MDAEFGGSVPKRNFGMIISNQLHSFEEMCRKGRSGVGHGCGVWRKCAGNEL